MRTPALASRVVNEAFVVSIDGMKIFGVLDLKRQMEDADFHSVSATPGEGVIGYM